MIMEQKFVQYYKRGKYELQKKWRKTHKILLASLSAVIVLCELAMSFIAPNMDYAAESWTGYLFKYLYVPVFAYLIINMFVFFFTAIDTIPGTLKNYIVSMGFGCVAICACMMHDYFIGVFGIGIIVILITAVYCNVPLTISTTAFVLIGETLVGFLSHWDSAVIKDSQFLTNLIIFDVLLIGTCAVSIVIIYWEDERIRVISESQMQISELQEEATIDPLTGLYNRRALDNYIQHIKEPVSFVMMDIDKFKQINDTYGHSSGDIVLTKIGEVLHYYSSEKLSAFRYGGDEFLLAITEYAGYEIEKLCKIILSDYQNSLPPDLKCTGTTLSTGIAFYQNDEEVEKAIARADAALYIAKKGTDGKKIVVG